MQISIERAVISGIISHALAHKREVSGLLLGPGLADERILVSDFVVYKVVGSEAQVEIPVNFLAKIRESLDEKKKYIIGWYHSHPQRNAFISRTDAETQKRLQQFNDNFVSLNVACREENGDKSKTITEIICYKLRSDGKPEFFSIQIVDRFSSDVAVGEVRADIEKARTVLDDLRGILDSSELTAEFVQPILRFNRTIDKIILVIAEEVERLQSTKLPDIEEKTKKIQEENENIRENNRQLTEESAKLTEELANVKRIARERLLDMKTQTEKREQELTKELQTTQNEYIKNREENKNLKDEIRKVAQENRGLLKRLSILETENSELRKEIKELKEERFEVEIFEEKKEKDRSEPRIVGKQSEWYPQKSEEETSGSKREDTNHDKKWR